MNSIRTFAILLTVTCLVILPGTVGAQPGMQMEQFREEKIRYFNENLELTATESEEFWPVYEDMNNRRFKINDDEKSLLSYIMSNSENMSGKELDESIDKYLDLQQKRFELDSQYHDKYLEILGKKKTMKLYALERDFRMHLLRKFRGREGMDNRGRGRNFR